MRRARITVWLAAVALWCMPAVSGRAAGEVPASAGVVVVGGGSGGVAAALQAARMGATVVLLEEGAMLGGAYTSAGVACFDGNPYDRHTEALTTGIFGEIVSRIRAYYGRPEQTQLVCCEPAVADAILKQMAAAQASLTVVYRARVTDVLMEGTTARGVAFLDEAQQLHEIAASVLVDATDYGDVAALAGVECRLGRESWAETAEDQALGGPFNGETGWRANAPPDGLVQAPTQIVVLRNMRAPAPIIARPPVYDVNRFFDFANPLASWSATGEYLDGYTVKYILQYSALTPPGTSAAALDLLRPGTWPDYFFINWAWYGNEYVPAVPLAGLEAQQRASEQQNAKYLALGFARMLQQYLRLQLGYNPLALVSDQFTTPDGLPPSLYVREGRRIVGLYSLTAHDVARLLYKCGVAPGSTISPAYVVLRGAHMWDGIAVGDYPIDIHLMKPLEGYYTPSLMRAGYRIRYSGGGGGSTVPFQVPYRSLVPQTVDGLLIGDKAISVTHVANGATRLQPIVTLIGQAAGAAAALAAGQGIAPRQVNVRQLQQALIESGDALYYFSDIYPSHPAFKEIQAVSVAGIMSARYPDPAFPRVNQDYDDWRDHAFYPERQATRSEVAVHLTRAMGLEDCAASSQYFLDVGPEAWEYNAVDCLRRGGVISGCSVNPNLFCPGGALNRAQMVTLVVRAKGLAPYDNPVPTFRDVPRSSWAYPFVEAAYAAGLTARIAAPPYFLPSRSVTRMELAVFLYDAFWPGGHVNQPPELILSRYASGQRFVLGGAPGNRLEAWFRAHDPDGDQVAVSVENMPAGAAFVPETGLFAWTPSADDVGNRLITVSATDGRAATRQQFSIVVGPRVSIHLASGEAATTSPDVTLAVNWKSAVSIRFGYTGLSGWTPWEPIADTKQLTLSAGDGGKAIQAQAADALGNVSPTATMGVTLDTTPPAAVALIIQEGLAQTWEQTLRLHIIAVDWGTYPVEMRFQYPGQEWTAWELFAPYKYIPRPISSGVCEINVQVRDAIGNESGPGLGSIILRP